MSNYATALSHLKGAVSYWQRVIAIAEEHGHKPLVPGKLARELSTARNNAEWGEYGYSYCLREPEAYNSVPSDRSEEHALLQQLATAKQRYSELRKQYAPPHVSQEWLEMSDEVCRQKVQEAIQALRLDLEAITTDEAQYHVVTYLETHGEPTVDRLRVWCVVRKLWHEGAVARVEHEQARKSQEKAKQERATDVAVKDLLQRNAAAAIEDIHLQRWSGRYARRLIHYCMGRLVFGQKTERKSSPSAIGITKCNTHLVKCE